ncbi:MAG: Spy/CpxP family protein refolding chaperone [Gemmatimonadaceae bacterium]|nr:Spy/CpxP family protein refolding chaperone [Gemmatimonadaceae bacterium]
MIRTLAQNLPSPTKLVLDHASELKLTPSQVTTLTALDARLKDSMQVRVRRMNPLARATSPRFKAAMAPLLKWEGTIDEATIRSEACANSSSAAEMMIATMRDRVTVGAVLTAAQRGQLGMLQAKDAMTRMGKR